ncbi:hypothetical protein NPIL_41311 [Nephila pilipes]|uniref:Uncharacterized protein n=1 Tax=Nephila pilipes TaxID=299642 RepID=A0A8X6Q4L9_NEPPI|nr:hypothetical protein NPIL_41311 [Nephila pilipes]
MASEAHGSGVGELGERKASSVTHLAGEIEFRTSFGVSSERKFYYWWSWRVGFLSSVGCVGGMVHGWKDLELNT